MKLKISFKNIEHTPALDQRIQEKSEKFDKYFQGSTSIQWFCYIDDNKHWAEIKVHGPKFSFFAKACSDNMYKSFDLAVDKMERQIEKKKMQRRNKMHNHGYESPKYQDIFARIEDEEQVEFQEKWEESA